MDTKSLQMTSLGLAFLASLIGNNPAHTAQLQAATDPHSLAQLAVQLGEEHGYHFT